MLFATQYGTIRLQKKKSQNIQIHHFTRFTWTWHTISHININEHTLRVLQDDKQVAENCITYLHDGYSLRTRSIGIGVSACRNNLGDLSVNKSILKWTLNMASECVLSFSGSCKNCNSY